MNHLPIIRTYVGMNIVSTIVALTLNFLAVSLPINNKTTAELSDSYPNFFVPAGFTFSIWGIIYLLIIGFTIFQAWQYNKDNSRSMDIIKQIGPWYFISGLSNAAWILAWHYEMIFLSFMFMTILIFSLIKIYRGVWKYAGKNRSDTLMLIVPFSIYLGWISVATIANITTLLVSIGWNGMGITPLSWTVLMMMISVVLSLIMGYKYRDPAYVAVIIWAIYGIYSKQSDIENQEAQTIAMGAKGIVIFLTFLLLVMIFRKRTYLIRTSE